MHRLPLPTTPARRMARRQASAWPRRDAVERGEVPRAFTWQHRPSGSGQLEVAEERGKDAKTREQGCACSDLCCQVRQRGCQPAQLGFRRTEHLCHRLFFSTSITLPQLPWPLQSMTRQKAVFSLYAPALAPPQEARGRSSACWQNCQSGSGRLLARCQFSRARSSVSDLDSIKNHPLLKYWLLLSVSGLCRQFQSAGKP